MICPACGNTMRPVKAWVFRCDVCHFLSSTLEPKAGTGIPGLETLRRRNFEILLDRLERIRPIRGLKILEVGCAWGWFLEALNRRGAAFLHGIEPEEANAAICRSKSFSVEHGFFPQDLKDRGPYDLVLFNDVFEHLPNPDQMIKEVSRLLRPQGLVVLNLPSTSGVFFRIATILDNLGASSWLERLWQKDFSSPHISYFNPGNLKLLVETHTELKQVQSMSLTSVSRRGLAARIRRSHKSVSGLTAISAIWCLSFALPLLPSDVHVAIFSKPS